LKKVPDSLILCYIAMQDKIKTHKSYDEKSDQKETKGWFALRIFITN